MSDLDPKSSARKAAFARRKAAYAAAADAAAASARDVFLSEVTLRPGEVVSGYRPIRTEIDATPLMTALHARGVDLCVPVIDGAGLPLSFRRWTPEARMISGAFGAEIPADGEELEPTLLIAPLVAFDARGYRLGYGGGFYDRTLEKLRAARPTRAVGYAFAAQQTDALPTEPTDQPLDMVVTEERAHLFPRD